MTPLDQKIGTVFDSVVVRKDLVSEVKGSAVVPSFVLEYLLAQYCATTDEATIQTGIGRVQTILSDHYVHRSEARLVQSMIREKHRPHKVIDRVSVKLNDKKDIYEATFANLGIDKVPVDSGTIKAHEKLLVTGVWCLADVEYDYAEGNETPWSLDKLKPIQISSFDFDGFLEKRKEFTTEEWIDILMQSIGLNPEHFGSRSKLLALARLIPFCERNYNLIELGPKGTGKSHIYSEFSPHGMLISGGEVTVPKLFVENKPPYRIGLVGYWDTVAFDEFAGKKKTASKALVDILKNYMANKTFSRGVETLGAEASMVFVGNTQHTVPYMLKHSNLFDELPTQYYDSAFLDRIHSYIPGWEMDNLRREMFTDGFGFVVDYFAEILRKMRAFDFSTLYESHFSLHASISTRDRDAINKTFSGLMKLLYPNREATADEIEELLKFSIECRKRVKDQLMRIDDTYSAVRFSYTRKDKSEVYVSTLEETQFPAIYDPRGNLTPQSAPADEAKPDPQPAASVTGNGPQSGHRQINENQKGIDYEILFAPYLKGATKIEITDGYIRRFHQARNLMELLELIGRLKADFEEVEVALTTVSDPEKAEEQEDFLQQIKNSVEPAGIHLSWKYDSSTHDRSIVTDQGWKIILGRGLDIFQHYPMNDALAISNRQQRHRSCRPFEITYVKLDQP
jgi:ATP-dependent Lon protease